MVDAGVIHTLYLDMPQRRAFALYDGMQSRNTLEHCLKDLVLPRLLASDGQLVLHGSLVATAAGLVGFIGASGQGKSTLSGSLHVQGVPLLTDDAFRLQQQSGQWSAKILFQSLRLLPDAMEYLFPEVDETTPVADYTSKRHLKYAGGPDGGPIIALFRLGDDVSDVCVQRLNPAEACIALISNAFSLEASDSLESQPRFANASAAASAVPVYDLQYPRDFSRLPEVHAAIFEAIGLPREECPQ